MELKPPFNGKRIFEFIRSGINVYDQNERSSISYLIIEHLFNLSKTAVLLNQEVDHMDWDKITAILNRINQSEPIQYVLGETEFYGRKFKVNKHVLIPRPETEELVNLIIKENSKHKKLKVLDIGTGSGCISITLAKELQEAEIYALDISKEALIIATENAKLNIASVDFSHFDIIQNTQFKIRNLDIIVSNPPYVRESEKKEMHSNVLEHEPHTALFVKEEDPLIFYRRIILFAKDHLKNNGKCYFEINEKFGQELADLFHQNDFSEVRIIKDLQDKDRIAVGVLRL